MPSLKAVVVISTILFLLNILSTTTTTNALLIPLLLKKKAISITRKQLFKKKKKQQQQKAAAAAAFTIVGGGAAAVTIGGLSLLRQRQEDIEKNKYTIYQPDAGSLIGQTIVITGGSSGLGLESAKRLAFGGANIIVTARTSTKGNAAVQQIRAYLEKKQSITEQEQEQRIEYKVLNMDDLQSMKDAFSSSSPDWDDVPTVDVLLNNAGVMAIPTRELTIDGFERQIQSNHLGHFLFTSLLSTKFSKRARIINVSSSAHQFAFTGIKFDYLWKAEKNNSYGPWRSYGQSKLANIYFTTELQRRIDDDDTINWSTATLHPGVVPTNLARYSKDNNNNNNNDTLEAIPSTTVDEEDDNNNAPKLFLQKLVNTINPDIKSIEQGASTQVWLASGAEFEDIGGKFYDRCKEQQLAPFALNRDDGTRLWKESEQLVGTTFFQLPHNDLEEDIVEDTEEQSSSSLHDSNTTIDEEEEKSETNDDE